MKKEIDIYNYPRKLESAIKCMMDSAITERNKKIIMDFRDFCSLNNLGLPRITRYISILRDWARLLNVDFDKATKEDMQKAVRIIQENNNYSSWTKSTYKIMLKRFYKWLKNTGDTYPEEVKWVTTTIKRTEKHLPSNGELLTEEEVKKLIKAADHPRDKSFIAVLYESGARIGEIGSLQIGNVKFDQYGAVLHVQGKTGPRPIRVIFSTSYLVTWINSHPFSDDASSPLWVNIGTTKHNRAMRYSGIYGLLRDLFLKAEMKKRFNPHMFRHSRATFLADHLTEFQMNQYFGWIQGSKMPSTYVHMSGNRIDNSILELNGIKSKEKSNESTLKPVVCSRCGTINSCESKFCNHCAGILDSQVASEMQAKMLKEKEQMDNTNAMMNTLMHDKNFMAMMVEKMKEMGVMEKI